MPASNTHACFSEFIGQKVVGVLFNACPPSRRDLAVGTKTLVFEDGRGLTVSSNGSYWVQSAEDVQRAIRARHRELEEAKEEVSGILALAGALEGSGPSHG